MKYTVFLRGVDKYNTLFREVEATCYSDALRQLKIIPEKMKLKLAKYDKKGEYTRFESLKVVSNDCKYQIIPEWSL